MREPRDYIPPADRTGQELPCQPPVLPAGHEAHSVWAFDDPTGRFSYAFNRVYGPSDRGGSCGPVCLLDEDLSYWGVTWTAQSNTGEDHRTCRWVSYAEARKLLGSLTFKRFSSLLGMRAALPGILNVAEVEA